MKKSIILLLIINILFIGCEKKNLFPENNQCDRIRKRVQYIESKSVESSFYLSLDDENRLYQGLKHCRDREEKSSADYIEIQRLMGVVDGLIEEADELKKEFHEIHGK